MAAVRAVYMVVLLLAAGTALFRVLVPVPDRLAGDLKRGLSILSATGVIMAAGYLRLGGTADPALATSLTVAIAGFLVLWLCNRWTGPRWLAVGVAVLVLSRALTGHPVEREPGWLLMPGMALHVSCAAYWAGSLWPLHRALAHLDVSAAATIVERFSTLAVAAVVALAFIGLITAQLNMGVLVALTSSAYGRLLLIKLAGFGVLMGFAGYHKLRLTPRLADGDAAAASRLRLTIVLEATVMALVVLLSTLLAATSPDAAT